MLEKWKQKDILLQIRKRHLKFQGHTTWKGGSQDIEGKRLRGEQEITQTLLCKFLAGQALGEIAKRQISGSCWEMTTSVLEGHGT